MAVKHKSTLKNKILTIEFIIDKEDLSKKGYVKKNDLLEEYDIEKLVNRLLELLKWDGKKIHYSRYVYNVKEYLGWGFHFDDKQNKILVELHFKVKNYYS